jgi:hypothetical protein
MATLDTSAKATKAVTKAAPKADTRNLHWKSNNVGLKLLEKMGWKDGQAVGKRQREDPEVEVSSEGLRIIKRSTGLGLGASTRAPSLASSHHVQGFSNLLEQLKEDHPSATTAAVSEGGDAKSKKKSKKSKKKESKATVLPTNRITHQKVRAAKFQQKTADDMRCIFGGTFSAVGAAVGAVKKEVKNNDDDDVSPRKSKKQKTSDSNKDTDESSITKKEKKDKKKSKKDKKAKVQ